ncbi:hypothetical protein L6452_05830 [Arctium lappa]|uniref:Uncharacterized protein n=1 Tax=Arctium lappa TaxID=4217 RepID=A0ACB9EGW9_ARCLA|nr:hypothetical protein L6452_05830 [Arctium lappa]
MTPPDITARSPYDFFNKCHPKSVDLDEHSEELHPKGPTHLKTTSWALLQAVEVLAPTSLVALTDSTFLAITCYSAKLLCQWHYRWHNSQDYTMRSLALAIVPAIVTLSQSLSQ